MKKRLISGIICTMMAVGMIMPVSAEEANTDFAGEELSILVSQGWMDNRYDETIARFEETYDVTVDLQTIPADQYSDLLQNRLATDSCADVFFCDCRSGKILHRLYWRGLGKRDAGNQTSVLQLRWKSIWPADLAQLSGVCHGIQQDLIWGAGH